MDVFVLSLIASLLGSAGIGAIIIAILQRRWKVQDENNEQMKQLAGQAEKLEKLTDQVQANTELNHVIVKAQKVIMADRVNYLGICCINARKIPISQKKIITQMYEAYEDLPGENGYGLDTIMKELDKVEVTKE